MSEPLDAVADPATSTPFNPSDIPEAKADQSVAATTSPTLTPSPTPTPVPGTPAAPLNRAAMDEQSMQQLQELPDTKRTVANAKAMLYDREGFGGKAPQALLASKGKEDPQLHRDGTAAVAGMSALLGLPSETVAENFTQYQNKVEGAMGWDHSPNVGGFANNLATHFKTQDAQQEAVVNLQKTAIADSVGNKNPLQAFTEWKDSHADALKGMPEAQQLQTFQGVWAGTQKEFNTPEGRLAQEIVNAVGNKPMGEQVGGDLKETLSRTAQRDPILNALGITSRDGMVSDTELEQNKLSPIIDKLLAIQDPEQRKKVYQLAGILEQQKNPDQKGIIPSLYSLGQSLSRAANVSYGDSAQSIAMQANDDQPGLSRLRMGMELKDAAKNQVNPLLYSNMTATDAVKAGLPQIATKIGQGLAATTPYLAATAVAGPVAGLLYMGANGAVENQQRLMIQNPSMTPNEAAGLGTLISIPATVAGAVSMNSLTGVLPALDTMLSSVAEKGLQRWFVNTAVQGTAFTAANASGVLGDAAIHAINPEWNKDSDAGAGLHQVFLNAPQDFAMGAIFSLFHAGKPVDQGKLVELAGDPANLVKQGIPSDAAKKAAETAPEERAQAVATALEQVTPEQRQDGIDLSIKQAETAKKAVEDPNSPQIVHTDEGNPIVITHDEKGDVAHSQEFQTEEAAQAAYQMAMDHHVEINKPTEEGNDWTTATEESPIAKTEMPTAVEEDNIPMGNIDTKGAEQAATDQLTASEEQAQPATERQASRIQPDKLPITYLDPKIIKMSEDVPNFKEGASADTGVVDGEQLQGDLDLKGMGPLLVWERLNGDHEIISGRHRLDLANRSSDPLVPVQIFKESEGHTKEEMMTLDAEQNIKDEKGTVKDYANYFRNTTTSQEEAAQRGLLSRSKGRAGFQIGRMGGDDLYALFSAGKISEAKAAAIAQSAPNDAGLQQAAMRRAGDLKAEELPGYIALLKREAGGGSSEQIGLFGDDETFIKEAERLSKAAAARVRDISDQIAAVQGAAKRPEAAAKLGVDVKDPSGLEKRLEELKDERARFSQFWNHPDLMEQLGAKPKAPSIDANGEGNLFHEKDMPFSLAGETEQSQESKPEAQYKEDDQTGSLFETPAIRNYLASVGVEGDIASRAEDEIKSAIKEISKTGEGQSSYGDLFSYAEQNAGGEVRTPGDLPPIHGVNLDASNAFKQNGDIVSHLIHSLISREIPSFNIDGAVIHSPRDFATLLMPLRSPFFESVKVAFLDKDNKVIHSQILNVGTVNESVAHPRDFLLALTDAKKKSPGIASAIFAHNHPSGDPSPSEADKNLTGRVEKAFKAAGIFLKDHIITNGEKGYSFNAGGKFDISAGLAPWESASRSSLKAINGNDKLAEYIKNLRQGVAPETAHIIYSNTQFRVTGVERVPNGAVDADAMRNALIAGIGREGPAGVFIDVSGKSGMASDGVIKAAKDVAENALIQINDISTKDVPSHRAEGILQGRPRAYNENGLREDPKDQQPRGAKAKAFFTPDKENGNKVAPALSFKEQAKITAGKVLDAVRDLPADSDFKREVLKWSARSQGSTNEIERVQHSIEQAVPDNAKREGITNWIEAGGDKSLLRERAAASTDKKLKAGYEAALNLTPEELALANKVKQTFSVLETRAKKYGIDMGHRENYVPHIFEQEPQPPSGTSPKRLSEFFKFSQTRVFDSYFEGEQITDKEGKPAPYKAQTKDIGKLLGTYMNDMNNAINSRRFVEELSKGKSSDGMPLVSPRGGGTVTTGEHGEQETHLIYPDMAKEGTEHYKTIDQPALHDWTFAGKDDLGKNILVKGDLAVHPEVAKHLSNALGSSAISKWMQTKTENPFLNGGKWVADKAFKAQSLVKGTMLSFSPFHQVQEGIHALGHRINPFSNIPEIDLRDPTQADAAAHGLMIAHDRLSQSLFMEGVGSNDSNLVTIGLRKIGWGLTTAAADKVDSYQHWLFSQYIPGLKLKTYEHILERNMERYKADVASGEASEWQVKVLSAKQSNAAYGHLNYTEMGHNPTIRHAMQLALLAPDFLEARSRFVGQAFKGIAGGKVGSEQLQALAFLAVTQFVAATIQKVLTNGDPEFGHPFEMRFGNKYYGVRSVPEDIYKLATNATGFIGGRISPIFGRFVQEGIFGVNYRGEHTTVGDAITNIMTGAVPMPMQALTRQWTSSNQANPISWWEQILASAGVQVHRYSPITKVYPMAKEWLKKNHPEDQSARGTYPVSKFQQLRYACEDGDQEKVAKEIEHLKTEYKLTPAKIASGFRTSVNHPFTGSEAHDADMVKTFNEDQKEMYHAAVERRKVILQRFSTFRNASN